MADLTPWEEINPPMGSAPRPVPASQSSDARLTFRNELTACLTLTAPVGMTEEAKRDWFAVAWETLKDIPPDILAIGAKKARQRVDHPSKIVPAIVEETRELMRWRRESDRYSAELNQPRLPKPDYVTPAEASKILGEFGLRK